MKKEPKPGAGKLFMDAMIEQEHKEALNKINTLIPLCYLGLQEPIKDAVKFLTDLIDKCQDNVVVIFMEAIELSTLNRSEPTIPSWIPKGDVRDELIKSIGPLEFGITTTAVTKMKQDCKNGNTAQSRIFIKDQLDNNPNKPRLLGFMLNGVVAMLTHSYNEMKK